MLRIIFICLFLLPHISHAQVAPYVFPATIGTAPASILPVNKARRRVIFFNPNPAAMIAFCPAGPARNSTAFTCAVGGAGSITVLPYSSVTIDGGTPSGPPLAMSGAWNAVADTASSKFTVLEFE